MRPNQIRIAVIAASLAFVLAGVAISKERGVIIEEASGQGEGVTMAVRSERIEARPWSAIVKSSARVEAIRQVLLDAPIERVGERHVAELQRVDAGALLFRLDATFAQAAVARADGALEVARARLRLADIELARQRDLDEKKVSSPASLDAAKASAQEARGALREVEGRVLEAREALARTEIRAPFSGMIENIAVEVGARVPANGVVAELVDVSRVELHLAIGEREAVALDAGAALEVEVSAGVSRQVTLVRVGRVIDPATRRVAAIAEADNADAAFLVGSVVDVTLSLDDPKARMIVPREAVFREFALDYVFILVERADVWRAERRSIRTLPVPFRPELVEIVEGVKSGDLIAVDGLSGLSDGAAVRISG